VRRAAPADRIALVRMARDFLAASGLGLPFDPAWVERSAYAHIAGGDRVALVLEAGGRARGMLAGAVAQSPLAPVTVAEEIAWWIDPEARSLAAARAMLAAFEAWARDRGAAVIGLATLDGRAGPLYRRAGYAPAEARWMKAL